MSAGEEIRSPLRENRTLLPAPLPPDEARATLAAAAGVSTVGLRPPFDPPAAAFSSRLSRRSHLDCRAAAARSKYVDEEIRRFKALGHAARVIPIIVDGEPHDPQRECFPPAVRFKVGRDAELTSEREEPIAADARPQGDGKEIAKRKVIAGLLGLGFDEIARRAERARRRRNLLRIGLGSFAVVLVVAIAFTWWAMNLFSAKLSVADDLNWVREAADLCEQAATTISGYKIPEGKRITLASECVDTFNQFLTGLPVGTPTPIRVASSLERYITVLRTFEAQHKLTPHQSDILSAGETLAAQIDRQ